MKKLVFATMMCVAAMSANAQVLTSETVNNSYENAVAQADGDYAFNAEMTGKDITTMYVYKKNNSKGMTFLKPYMKYDYTYAADGTLANRVVYRWIEGNWASTARYDYNLDGGKYTAEYSLFNPVANRFDQPLEKMVYTMMPDDSVNYVSCYHRNNYSSRYQLVSTAEVAGMPLLFAEK